MPNLVEITGADIALLGDDDLRELIGLLCEADYRLASLPTTGITWGGHQDAPDGGLDVMVRGETPPPHNSFIPRPLTGFQVKKSDMTRARITKEMRPKDRLREAVTTLKAAGGAYIIVSSGASTTDTALDDRVNAMKDAIADEENHQNLHLDFLDRGRLATWVRLHPSLIIWVRNKIGRPLSGWSPYGNWAGAPQGLEEEYLLDDSLRLHDGTLSSADAISAKKGLQKLRSELSRAGVSIRLTGLSGVGKTRLVQALFDERVGDEALAPNLALYTDISNGPDPNPKTLAEQLIAERARAVLIVDNCPPDLHRQLAQTCRGSHSTISLLTVEYDICDDLPEETQVFRLEPASDEIIEKLIIKRFAHIGQVDARTIAAFSGGNARIAIALAETVQNGETLSGFRDEELFKRLFWQRNSTSNSLLFSAQVCALVYSLEGAATSAESELSFLANLIEKSASRLYSDVVELRKRGLVQARDVWRAVLPHAIANRLAKEALETIAKDTLVQAFVGDASERLLKSFTRRLSYLHDCPPAIEIVDEWLAPDGWLGRENCNFSFFGMEVFKNVARVAPNKTLETIERSANGQGEDGFFTRELNAHRAEFVKLLRHLAYDPDLFERSVSLMCRYALAEEPSNRHDSTREVLKSLFHIYLSGTHATVETRAKIVKSLADSADQGHQELGLFLLDAALQTGYFGAFHESAFGAWPRDYGYRPKTRAEVKQWYEIFISICTGAALSESAIAQKARGVLAANLRGLWTKGGMHKALENAAAKIHAQKPWNDGWIAVCGILRHDSEHFNEEVLARLHELEKLFKPNNLLELARTFAFVDDRHVFDLGNVLPSDGDDATGWRRTVQFTQEIGAQVSQESATLNALLPELVSESGIRLGVFGHGLADGCADKKQMWNALYAELEKTPTEQRQIEVLLGFMEGCAQSEPVFYDSTLDNLIDDNLLGQWFPRFQVTATVDQRGIARLHEALDAGNIEIETFECLAYGRAHESIGDDDLAGLLQKIIARERGAGVAVSILSMRFYRPEKSNPIYSARLMAVARETLATGLFLAEPNAQFNLDYQLAQIIQACLSEHEGITAATQVCHDLAQAITDHGIYAHDYPETLNALASAQPLVFLDAFLGAERVSKHLRSSVFSDDFDTKTPLDQIADDDVLAWCDNDPRSRYQNIVLAARIFGTSADKTKLEWKPIMHHIFEKAPELSIILNNTGRAIEPTRSIGSLATALEDRSVLFEDLYEHGRAEVRSWAKGQYLVLQDRIARARETEARENREYQRFE